MATVDWITSAEFKAQMEITGTGRDPAINACITAASRALNRRCGRELTPQTADATRTFRVPIPKPSRGEATLVDLKPYDLRTVVHVKVRPEEASPETLVANDDYALWPIGGAKTTASYWAIMLASDRSLTSTFSSRFGYAQLEVKGAWGVWATADVPEDVKRACIVTVGSWLDKAVAEYGAEFNDQPRAMQASVFSGYAVPLAAVTLLGEADLIRSIRGFG